MNIKKIEDWGISKVEHPFVIAGPCSAETEDQLYRTVLELSKTPISMIRAGIWKPRTRPNTFEGVGEIGLGWLKSVSEEFNLPTCVEVASPEHVELALKYGVDVLWIGARSTANPFTVQSIADALKGVDIPVFIKNPVNPDLQLWIGAIERIYNSGIQKIAAIHRGFSFYGHYLYRNMPQWEIPIELRRQIPQLEILCDPSHIGGKREHIHEIAQHALHLDFDGLMIETHIDPENAWSDAAQQITPSELAQLLENLIKPVSVINDPILLQQLEKLRASIDDIDFDVIELLSERMELVRQIGHYKKSKQITILQIERWAEIFKSRQANAEQLQLDKSFIENIMNAIHQESIRQQAMIMNHASKIEKVDKK